MRTTRLEAFSDGVIAILITIMVFELKVGAGDDFAALREVLPGLSAYVLSFVYLGIYWNNHHHMLHTADRVTGGILWANLHLLFWLSLVPAATGWLGGSGFAAVPAATYGGVMLMAGLAYFILQQRIIAAQGPDSLLKRAVGDDRKGRLSQVLYVVGIAAAFFSSWVSVAMYVLVALIWLVPDRRVESALGAAARDD